MAGSVNNTPKNAVSSAADGGSTNGGGGGGGGGGYNNYNTYIKVLEEAETHDTFNVKFYNDTIRTTVTHTASIADEWIDDVYSSFANILEDGRDLVVGLDVEWVRLRDTCQRNKVAVLQLCLAHRCLIFQFFYSDKIPKKLVDFLNDERIVFVGAGIDQDAHKLWVDYRLYVARSEDLGALADYKLGREGLYEKRLTDLVDIVLEQYLPKDEFITMSRWDVGDRYDGHEGYLRDYQIKHACLDAYASFKVGIDLIRRPRPDLPLKPLKAVNKGFNSNSQKDFKKTPRETSQGQGDRETNQGQETKAPHQGQGQGTKSPNQGQGSRGPYEYERRNRKPTLQDFMMKPYQKA